MSVTITAVTPIHIGSGDSYIPMEYVVKNNIFHYIPHEKLFRTLDRKILRKLMEKVESDPRAPLGRFFQENSIDIGKMSAYEAACGLSGFNEVRSFIKTMGRIYLPGSELKGAIRTAILYDLLGEAEHYSWLIAEIERVGKDNRRGAEKLEEAMQQRLLYAPQARGDARYDILKFLQFADSEGIEVTPDGVFIGKVVMYKTSKSGGYAEFVRPATEFNCDYAGKVRRIPDPVKAALPHRERQWGILQNTSWRRACYAFSRDLLQWEKECWKDDRNMLKEYEDLEAQNEEAAPLLKLGASGGFFHSTIMLRVKHKHPKLISEIVRTWTKGKNYPNFPKTYRSVSDGQYEYPIGWVKIHEENRSSI